MLKHLSTFLLPVLLTCSAATSHAAIVLADDFSEADGTALNNKAPDIGGGNWSVVAGDPLNVTGGQYNTTGARREVYVNFLAAPTVAVPQLYATFDVTLISHNAGLAGFSFYDGPNPADERFFVGDRNGDSTTWGVERSGGGPSGNAAAYSGPHTVTFAYNFNSGLTELYDGSTATGTPLVSFTTTTGLALSRLRGLNDGGGDYALSNVSVNLIPEPGASLLLGAGLGALLLGRRRSH